MTRVYRVASIDKHIGFGVSVLQRLCKTSIKKNLYYEIKEKVIEESFNGVRVDRRKARVKVYGLDSTKETRARLIELLHERVQYHKDKFIAPLLHHELETLEVDSKGKTQAIYPNHDDQVFSYLMALYVWYDGKDLAENFGIIKNTLKTDEDIEELDGDIEKNENVERVKLEKIEDIDNENDTEDDKKLKQMFIDSERTRTVKTFEEEQYDLEQARFDQFLRMNRDAKAAYEKKYNIQSVENSITGLDYIKLPDSLFGNVCSDYDIDYEQEELERRNGNLFSLFDKL